MPDFSVGTTVWVRQRMIESGVIVVAGFSKSLVRFAGRQGLRGYERWVDNARLLERKPETATVDARPGRPGLMSALLGRF